MHAKTSCIAYKNEVVGDFDIAVDLHPFIRKYNDGHIVRFLSSSFVPASEDPAAGGASRGVSTRDVVIDPGTGVSARLFLPSRAAATGRRLPLVIYIHGGAFCTESAFCRTYHRYVTSLAANAGALVVSVEYRLAPEHPIPTAYEDSWNALRWVASLSDPWLADYADSGRVFLAGDSAGGNIAYHMAVRASRDASIMDIEGLVVVQPFFWGTERLPSETNRPEDAVVLPARRVDWLWPLLTAGKASNDDPRLNPPDEEIASLACRRVLVAVAERDTLRDRGCQLAARMRRHSPLISHDVTLIESEGEDHGFHLYSPLRATSRRLMKGIVQFINQRRLHSPPTTIVFPELDRCAKLLAPETDGADLVAQPLTSVLPGPFKDVFAYPKVGRRAIRSTTHNNSSLNPGRVNASKSSTTTSIGFFYGRLRPDNATRRAFSVAFPGRSLVNNF